MESIQHLQGVTPLADTPNFCAQVHHSPCTFTGDSPNVIGIICYKCLSLAALWWILQQSEVIQNPSLVVTLLCCSQNVPARGPQLGYTELRRHLQRDEHFHGSTA